MAKYLLKCSYFYKKCHFYAKKEVLIFASGLLAFKKCLILFISGQCCVQNLHVLQAFGLHFFCQIRVIYAQAASRKDFLRFVFHHRC